jgi:ABC-type bacteriocin/lantibiotic exporter with double-glycine peptidase domain
MVDLIALGILALIIFGIMKAASGRRYEEMTEEQFEAEAKRSSAMGAAVSGLQKVVNPSHDSEHIIEQQQRIEAERTNSGDRRKPGTHSHRSTEHTEKERDL